MRYEVEILCEGEKLTVCGIEAKNEKDVKIEARKMYIARLCTSTSLPPNAFNSLFNKIIVNNVKLIDDSVGNININTDNKIIMAFTDPVDGDENPYKYFTDNFTGEGVHTYHIFDNAEDFIAKWEEINGYANGMWYWVLDKGKCICSGACDPDDIKIFKEHWGLE